MDNDVDIFKVINSSVPPSNTDCLSLSNLELALQLLEECPLVAPRYYYMPNGEYKMDDDNQWWFRKRHPEIPLFCRELSVAMDNPTEENTRLMHEAMDLRHALAETVPWVKSIGICGGLFEDPEMFESIKREVAAEIKIEEEK